jgi:hypothetical protein
MSIPPEAAFPLLSLYLEQLPFMTPRCAAVSQIDPGEAFLDQFFIEHAVLDRGNLLMYPNRARK